MSKALTNEQVRVAKTTLKAVEVVACPGSGKTQTLLARIDHLISEGLDPKAILVLSHTKVAAKVMKRRLATNDKRAGVVILDIHAFARTLILKNLRLLDFPGVPNILELRQAGCLLADAAGTVAKQLQDQLEDISRDNPKRDVLQRQANWLFALMRKNYGKLQAAISFGRATGMSLERVGDLERFSWLNGYAAIVKCVRIEYSRMKRARPVLDFDDLLTYAYKVATAKCSGGAPAKVSGLGFRHLLVDEYQDTSGAQARLIAALSSRIRRVMVVGDPHQAIYGFAGANYKPLSKVMEGVTTMTLTKSFRMPQPIADLATAVLAANDDGRGLETPSIKGKKGTVKPVLVSCLSELDQAIEVAARVHRLLISGAKPSEIVVLSRIKNHFKSVARSLNLLNIRNDRNGRDFDLSHVLTALRLTAIMENAGLLSRQLVSIALEQPNVSESVMVNVLRTCKIGARSHSLEGRYKASVKALLIALGGVREHPEIRAGLTEWAPLCRSYEKAAAMAQAIQENGKADTIKGYGIHQAKGGEWRHVFVIGATDCVIPDYHAQTVAEKIEERNALFVAITRASATLTVLHAPYTILKPHKKPERVDLLSQFLDHKLVLKRMSKEKSTEMLARAEHC